MREYRRMTLTDAAVSTLKRKDYKCSCCIYATHNLTDYKRHLSTQKHIVAFALKINQQNVMIEEDSGSSEYRCVCGKSYLHRSSLHNHRKKCGAYMQDTILNKASDFGILFDEHDKTMIGNSGNAMMQCLMLKVLQSNQELKEQLIELHKESAAVMIPGGDSGGDGGNINNNITINQNITTNNNQFNIAVFLNEECKDAINLSDFIKTIEISLDDLSYTRTNGLVNSISRIFISNLKQLDLYKRPIHCTDQKRNTIYIKDNHVWERDEAQVKLRKAILDIANKEYAAIKMWMDRNPGWEKNPRLQDIHHTMVLQIVHEMSEDFAGQRKIMKAIEREVFIEK